MLNNEQEHIEVEWLSALKAGDEAALRKIFDRHYPLLVADANRLLKDPDASRDLAQETFVELWKKRETLLIHTSLRAYLKRAVINKTLNYIKSRQKFSFEATDEQDKGEDSFEKMQTQEQQDSLEKALMQAVDQLPEKCRLVFTLSRFEDLSHKEIAEQLEISVKTIENQITKAMKYLRQALIAYKELSSIVILTYLFC